MIAQELIKQYLHYSNESGHFTWIKRTGDRINIGDIAGCIRNDNHYRVLKILGKTYIEHRLVWLMFMGNGLTSY